MTAATPVVSAPPVAPAVPVPPPARPDPLARLRAGYHCALAMGAGTLAVFVWMALTPVETAVQADATVVPVGQNRKAQHLEGGVVAKILVQEGDAVEPGQVLVQIAPEQAKSAVGERQARIIALEAMTARLSAEASGAASLTLPADATPAQKAEAVVFEANRRALANRIAALDEQAIRAEQDAAAKQAQLAGLHEQEAAIARSLALHRKAVASGAGSPARVIDYESQWAGIRAQMASLPAAIAADHAMIREAHARRDAERNGQRADAAGKLAQAKAELDGVRENAEGASDRLTRTDVRSPVRGVIQKMGVNDVGEVVPPNATVAEIVPQGDGLIIEARVRPEDMRGLRPGLPALIRLSAYDVSRFGSLDGSVLALSPDTVKEERTGQVFYKVRLRTAATTIGDDPIRVGMQASVSIITGRRTILEYLTAPITDWSQHALRDR